jgi:D-glucuronyl C5-epimerase C-terminus
MLPVVSAITLLAAAPALGAEGLVINAGAAATNNPNLTLALKPPPAAAFVQIAFNETFQSPTKVPVGPQVTAAVATSGPEERAVRVWVRYLDGASAVLPGAPLTEAIVFDTLPPRVSAATFTQTNDVFVCAAEGPDVGGTNRDQLVFRLQVALDEAGAGTPEFELADLPPVAGWRPPSTVTVQSRPLQVFGIRTRDALGNVSAVTTATAPATTLTQLTGARFPFTTALDCPHPSPGDWNQTVRAEWSESGRRAANKERVLIAPSALSWTFYQRNGSIALNWVIASTQLKDVLAARRMEEYRAGVSEMLQLSVTDRSGRGRTFRLNENWFYNPGSKQGIPWRDGMGTALILASLAAALPTDAPPREQDLALQMASEYLETFSVDYRNGGVLWRDSGPGQWFLEYAYLPKDRVLNGFMQSIVSLNRFAGQAERLGRGRVHAAEWRALASRARTHVVKGSRALNFWLPKFNLSKGRMRYSLESGPAPPFYVGYHQELLGQLSQITYVPRDWRRGFMNYRVRWGGKRLAVPSDARV